MLLSRFIFLASFASCSLGYTLPENLPDGVYEASIDSEGNEVHRQLGSNETLVVIPKAKRAPVNPRHLEKRAIDFGGGIDVSSPLQVRCGCE